MPAGSTAFKICALNSALIPSICSPRRRRALLDLLPRRLDLLLRRLPNLLHRRVPLGVPLLQLLARASGRSRSSRSRNFSSYATSLPQPRQSRSAPAPPLRWSAPPLRQHLIQRPPHQHPVRDYQQQKQHHRRHRAEHKFTELTQNLVHEWGRPEPLWRCPCVRSPDPGAGPAGALEGCG